MAYSVHIERPAGKITEDEWLSVLNARGDFSRVPKINFKTPAGQTITLVGPFDVWSGHPEGRTVSFRFGRGSASVDAPDEDVFDLLFELAEALAAKVVGDDGDVYEPESGDDSDDDAADT